MKGDSGGKVNICGGASVNHCETKSSYEYVSELLPRQGLLESTNTKESETKM